MLIPSSSSVIDITYGLCSLSIDILNKFDSYLRISPPMTIPADDDGETDDAFEDGLVEMLSKYDCY